MRLLSGGSYCHIAIYSAEGGRTVQWTKQNEQTVYANRWFTVNLADVELPDEYGTWITS